MHRNHLKIAKQKHKAATSRKKAQALFKLCDIAKRTLVGTVIHIGWAHPEGKGKPWAIVQMFFPGLLAPRHCTENQRDLFLLVKQATSSFFSCRPILLLLRNLPCLANTLKRNPWLLLGLPEQRELWMGPR